MSVATAAVHGALIVACVVVMAPRVAHAHGLIHRRGGASLPPIDTGDARLVFEVGADHHLLSAGGFAAHGLAIHPAGIVPYTTDGARDGEALVFQARGLVSRELYLALELEVGVAADASATSTTGTAVLAGGILVDGGLAFGARIALGAVDVRPELLTGLASVSYEVTTSLGDSAATALVLVVEPRLAVDVWLDAHTTVDFFGGVDLIALRDVSFGLAIAFHTRPHDV